MSTSYELIQTGEGIAQLHEHSNLFDLAVDNQTRNEEAYLRDLTPQQVVVAAMNMLQVASYWMDEDDLKKAVAGRIQDDGGKSCHLAGVVRSMAEAIDE